MTYFYSDTSSNDYNPSLINRLNPNNQYKKHLENHFFLKFILLRSDSIIEKAQANKELTICERKLTFWSNKPNFDQTIANQHNRELKSLWSST